MTLIEEFRKALGTVSFVRAGWDYYDMPLSQKKEEADAASTAKARLREIWRDNPKLRGELQSTFKDFGPLMTLDEIER